MKKILGFIFSIFIFIPLLFGCNKSKRIDNVDIYIGSNSVKVNGYKYNFNKNSFSYTTAHGYSYLEVGFYIEIENVKSKNNEINISNYNTYGNGKVLDRALYSEFGYDEAGFNYKRVEDESYIINKGQTKELLFKFIIPQGNMLAYYGIGMKINDVSFNFYNYKKDDEIRFETTYIHDPTKNDQAMRDIEEFKDAYYGFIPSETGSISSYRKYDYTNKDEVLGFKAERIEYHKSNNINVKQLEQELRNENASIETIARACSTLRNLNRLNAYDNNPSGLATVMKRNKDTYGNEMGPSPEYLFNRYQAENPTYDDNQVWEIVLAKAYSINLGMDVILGLYDDMFEYYGVEPMDF